MNLSQNTAIPNVSSNFASISTSTSDYSTSSDEEPERRRKRKRKWEGFFQRLMKEVTEKQEDMQKRFLETLERRERDRVAREEAWRVQEMARMNREHDLLVQERSISAAKDAAVVAFLEKVSDQQIPNAPQIPTQMQMQPPQNHRLPHAPQPPPPPALQPPPAQPQQQQQQTQPQPQVKSNGGENFVSTSSSRWPKAEIEALIRLRTNLDIKYQENGPKGPLWEEISAGMGSLGYSRSSKRCKEKWENINKYFKKVKESNKKRPEDSKTCPYFHQLDALYREKAKNVSPFTTNMVPIMVRPEQQWPLPEQQQRGVDEAAAMIEEDLDRDSENIGQNNEDEDGEDEEEVEEEEEDEASGYEIVTSKASSNVVGKVE